MPCEVIAPGVIACGRRRHAAPCQEPGCGRPHVALCDYPLSGPKAGQTCDRRMCGKHRHPVSGRRDTDYCGVHHRTTTKETEP